MFAIMHQKNRTRTYDIALKTQAGTDYTLAAEDEVLVHVYRIAQTPVLTLNTWEVDGGGSFVTFTPGSNDAVLKICQDDVAGLVPGLYDVEIVVLDDSDRVAGDYAAAKHVESGVFCLEEVSLGSIREEQSSSSN